jgi:glycosyltransferase involved in cell wall biosynthesis
MTVGDKGTAEARLPMVSVIIPMKNEERHIGACLQSVLDQDYPRNLVEVIVVDGGSTDSSLDIVEEFMKEYQNIKLLGGPGVNCPAAMNIGIRNAGGGVISKIDAHGYVATDFLRKIAEYLFSEDEIKCVGGPIRPVAQTIVAKANVLARSCRFGVGRGVYSTRGRGESVDTVQCGAYKKDIFGEVGLFDESLQFGEDEEINWRIRKRGYKILSTPKIQFFYFPRDSFRKLFRQYYNYGLTRVKVIRKHPDFLKVKHLIPAAFLLALLACGALGIFSGLFLKLFLGLILLYVTLSVLSSLFVSRKEGWVNLLLLPVSFGALHFGYGIGFGQGIVRLWFGLRVRP